MAILVLESLLSYAFLSMAFLILMVQNRVLPTEVKKSLPVSE
jgi:hypothetical protein